ncbi:DNA binding protein, nucleoid-associated [compost metagenome]
MTQTYNQIQKKIEELQRQAERLRDTEVQGVISRIKVAIEHYGLTAEQLGFGGKSGAKKAKQSTSEPKRSAKYMDDAGNVWSGRGPRPHWLKDAMNAGKSLEEFAVDAKLALDAKLVPEAMPAAPEAKSTSAKGRGKAKAKKESKRRPSTKLYQDGAGNTWTGRGPRPRWLTEALASGKTLEELSK